MNKVTTPNIPRKFTGAEVFQLPAGTIVRVLPSTNHDHAGIISMVIENSVNEDYSPLLILSDGSLFGILLGEYEFEVLREVTIKS